jgi:hypothetical protein
MVTAAQLLRKFGPPENETSMTLFIVPDSIKIDSIPKRIYCNKDLVKPLEQALKLIVDYHLVSLVKTWDGCFNIRKKRGASSPSLHSWGYAVDINAAWNTFGKTPTMPSQLVQCFKEAGFDWGGNWAKPDGMHFQLSHV